MTFSELLHYLPWALLGFLHGGDVVRFVERLMG